VSCVDCSTKINQGRLIYKKIAQGWQVRQLFSALEDLVPSEGRALAAVKHSRVNEDEEVVLPVAGPVPPEGGHYMSPSTGYKRSPIDITHGGGPRVTPAGPSAAIASEWGPSNPPHPHRGDTPPVGGL